MNKMLTHKLVLYHSTVHIPVSVMLGQAHLLDTLPPDLLGANEGAICHILRHGICPVYKHWAALRDNLRLYTRSESLEPHAVRPLLQSQSSSMDIRQSQSGD
jgi:hypothetical protein